MNVRTFASWSALAAFLLSFSHAQTVIFSDDFDDNTVTGWTFLDRNGEVEIANAEWVEANGSLEQLTANYDFRRGENNRPALGTIALAPTQVGGHYEISTSFKSLEPGNIYQDHSVIFAYADENNFLIAEAYAETNKITLFRVVEGNRTEIGANVNAITFNDDANVLTLRHDTVAGLVTVTHGDDDPLEYTDPDLIIEGDLSVGVGSNNDAFTIDDFTITSGFSANTEFVLEITALALDPQTGEVSVTWSSESGAEYFLDRSTDLISWDEVDDTVGEVGSTTLVDSTVGDGKVFYRVRSGE